MRVRPAILVSLALILAAPGVWAASGGAKGKGAGSKQAAAPPSKRASGSGKARTKRTGKRSRRQKGQTAPTADRISEIQQALAKEGSFKGPPNGKWDGPTVEAMRKFQEAHGLNPSGKLDALSLQKLGLGSTTAGVAAPVLPANSSSVINANGAQSAKRD